MKVMTFLNVHKNSAVLSTICKSCDTGFLKLFSTGKRIFVMSSCVETPAQKISRVIQDIAETHNVRYWLEEDTIAPNVLPLHVRY